MLREKFLSISWSSEHVQKKEEPGMRLHRLGRCVRRNAKGIMSCMMEDMMQSVTSLKSTRGRITSLWENCVFFSETSGSIGISALCLHIHPNLQTCSPASCAHFLSALIFDSLLLCFVVFIWAHSEYDFEAERCQQEAYSKEEHMISVVGVVQTVAFLISRGSQCV